MLPRATAGPDGARLPLAALLLVIALPLHRLLSPAGQAWWTALVIIVGLLGIAWGIRRNDPPRGSGWQRFLAGLTVYGLGDVLYVALAATVGPDHPATSSIWFAGFLGAPAVVSGLFRVLASGDPVRDTETRLDAAIAATALGIIGWHLVVMPLIARDGWLSYSAIGSTSLWLCTVLVLTFIVHRALLDGAVSVSLAFLAAAVVLTAMTSLVYFVHEPTSAWVSAPVSRVLHGLTYASAALATWHPSMRQLSAPARRSTTHGIARLAILLGGIMVLPAWQIAQELGVWEHGGADPIGVVLLLGLGVLCVLRVRSTVQTVDRHAVALARQAREDSLTGLPNRSEIMARLEEAVIVQGREGDVALLSLDLDRFKVVNDTLGHPAGDRLLVTAALRLRQAVGRHHLVGRLGGDEFVVLVVGEEDQGQVLATAARVASALAAPLQVDGQDVTTSTSVGVAFLGPGTATAAALLRDADVALYRAKADGGNGVVLFDASLRQQVTERARTERWLRRALAEQALDLAYQPIRTLDDGRIVAVEALLRGGEDAPPVGAEEMIRVAEATGLIGPLGEWVLDRVSADLGAWLRDNPGDPLRVAVNISGLQLRHPGFARSVLHTLDRAGVPPANIILELTETVLIEDDELTNAVLAELRRAGVGLAMDDFGTGYSALDTLRRVAFDIVKIDGSFVAGLGGDRDATAIVQAVLAMARAMDLEVIGEWVEHPGQADQLRDAGCVLGQGFHLGHPTSWGELTQALDRGGAGSATTALCG